MDFKKNALYISFAAAMALLNSTAFAIDMSSSEIIKTTGKVSVKKTNSPEFKKLNANLKLSGSLKNLNGGDKVRTFSNSSADLVLKDTCILAVKEQSIFEVPQVLNQKDLISLQAQQGSILFKVAKGSNFQVQTADVIAGVKGTMFSVTIVDGLNTMLETPGLQLGYAYTGGTAIDVYEGEVEVIHKKTNERVSLKAGQGLTAVNAVTNVADKTIEVVTFDPEAKARAIYGDSLSKLKNATFLKDLEGIDMLDEYNSKLYYDNNVIKKISTLDNPMVENYAEKISTAREVNQEVKEVNDIIGQFRGKKFRADFSRYSKMNGETAFSCNNFGEVYLGNNTLAACKASNGSSSLIAEPGFSGLVVTEGNGLIKMRIYNDKLKTTAEVMANVYEQGNDVITVIRNSDGRLSWREPGSLDIQRVPAGDVAYVFNKNTCKGRWMNAAAGSITEELASFNFSTEQQLQQEKKQVEDQNKRDKKEAAKKAINKVGGFLKKGRKFF